MKVARKQGGRPSPLKAIEIYLKLSTQLIKLLIFFNQQNIVPYFILENRTITVVANLNYLFNFMFLDYFSIELIIRIECFVTSKILIRSSSLFSTSIWR